MIGEQLYDLTPRDLQLTQLELFYQELVVTLASTSVDAFFTTVPLDRILIVSHILVQSFPGVGQIPLAVEAYQHNVARGIFEARIMSDLDNIGLAFNPGIAVSRSFTPTNLIIPSGRTVRAICSFNAGANPNTIRANLFGILIPRGNFAL